MVAENEPRGKMIARPITTNSRFKGGRLSIKSKAANERNNLVAMGIAYQEERNRYEPELREAIERATDQAIHFWNLTCTVWDETEETN